MTMEERPIPQPSVLDRQRGTTTEQMRKAHANSIYVWCNTHLDYPKALARHLGREDLKIVAPNWLLGDSLRGHSPDVEIVLDHAALLTLKREHWASINEHKRRLLG